MRRRVDDGGRSLPRFLQWNKHRASRLPLLVKYCFIIAILGALSPLAADTIHFASGPSRVALVELYSSEGCSSCPPAEAWMSRLLDAPALWTQVVPVQFHVNYWDNLGWKDRLATKDFTAREYAYAADWVSDGVYTPCFVRNGIEWKPEWGTIGGPAAMTGMLTVDVADDGSCTVAFRPGPGAASSPDGCYEAHLALLGCGISSKVTSGENNGARLVHEFVALGVAESLLSRNGAGPELRAELSLPLPVAGDARRRAVAVWITPHRELAPVQAAGSWLP